MTLTRPTLLSSPQVTAVYLWDSQLRADFLRMQSDAATLQTAAYLHSSMDEEPKDRKTASKVASTRVPPASAAPGS